MSTIAFVEPLKAIEQRIKELKKVKKTAKVLTDIPYTIAQAQIAELEKIEQLIRIDYGRIVVAAYHGSEWSDDEYGNGHHYLTIEQLCEIINVDLELALDRQNKEQKRA